MIPSAILNTAPATLPVSLAKMKTHLRVDGTDDNAAITLMVKAATQRLEKETGRKFVTQKWDIYFDHFAYEYQDEWWDGVREGSMSQLLNYCDSLILPFGPLQTVESFKTIDNSDTESTFSSSSYLVDTVSPLARISLRLGEVWPSTVLRPRNGIKIAATFGYGAGHVDAVDAVTSAIWTLTFAATPTSGNIILSYNGTSGTTLAYNFTLSQLLSALQSIGGQFASASCSGSIAAGFTITVPGFTGTESLFTRSSSLDQASTLTNTQAHVVAVSESNSVPEDIQLAVMGLVAKMYEHRGDEMVKIPSEVLLLIDPYVRIRV